MITLRTYVEADREALRALVLDLHETVRPLDPDLPPGDEIIDAYLAHLLAESEATGGTILVADAGGTLVGYACLFGRVPPREPDDRPEPHAYLSDLHVVAAHRGAGIGARLLARAEAHARALGVAKLELTVLSENAGAQRFYGRLGYTPRSLTLRKRL